MEEDRRSSGVLSAAAASNPAEADASSGDDEQSERPRTSEFDPYDYSDIADRFYACEIEEIPSFRWMTPSQRKVGPSEVVDPVEGSPSMLQCAPQSTDRLRIEMNSLLARKRELESRIRQSWGRQPRWNVKNWLREVEKECREVDILLNRRRSALSFLGARYQLRGHVAKKFKVLDQLHLQIAKWGDDDTIFLEESTESEWVDFSQGEGEILQSSNLKRFAVKDLRIATKNFNYRNTLGKGDFGDVFKGWVDEQNLMAAKPGTGIPVAIKRLDLQGFQGKKEWLNEIKYLSRPYHPNLVRLIGYCMDDESPTLVYEFISKGSLDNHLFSRGSYSQQLTWNLRMKIALGAAKGLAFLHSLEPQVIHRDVNASNILLDGNYDAKLCDFGLARDGPKDDDTHVLTRVMGSYGYSAPEYVATGRLTARCDVFGFGVVLLELLTGRRATGRNRPSDQQNLVEWGKPLLNGQRLLSRILDPSFEGQYPPSGAQEAASLTLRCLSSDPKSRPSMDEVVSSLGQLQNAQ